jgi:hypothetical protein
MRVVRLALRAVGTNRNPRRVAFESISKRAQNSAPGLSQRDSRYRCGTRDIQL